jgi:hypothetical protein
LNISKNKNLIFGSKIQIKWFWNPNHGLFGFWMSDFRIKENWIRLRIWIERKVWIFSKNGNLIRKIFEVLSEIKNWLRSKRKFESSDWIQIKGYSNSRKGFDLKEFPNLERCKPFQTRKVEIWSWDWNSNLQLWTKDILNSKARIWISKEDLVQGIWIQFTSLNSRMISNGNWVKFWVDLDQLDKEYFLNISRLSFKFLKIKPWQEWCIKWQRDYWCNDGTKSAWQWWIDMRVPGNWL